MGSLRRPSIRLYACPSVCKHLLLSQLLQDHWVDFLKLGQNVPLLASYASTKKIIPSIDRNGRSRLSWFCLVIALLRKELFIGVINTFVFFTRLKFDNCEDLVPIKISKLVVHICHTCQNVTYSCEFFTCMWQIRSVKNKVQQSSVTSRQSH